LIRSTLPCGASGRGAALRKERIGPIEAERKQERALPVEQIAVARRIAVATSRDRTRALACDVRREEAPLEQAVRRSAASRAQDLAAAGNPLQRGEDIDARKGVPVSPVHDQATGGAQCVLDFVSGGTWSR
jgi:hypothetical protein